MSEQQQRDQQPQAPALQQQADPSAEFVKKGALAAIGGAVSGTAKALWTHLFDSDA
ncbi:hypothetical protein [Streptomyces sp. NPDC048612]|uniref:hypothetical protein n=1 Tax=Streptomyces sp. NPDC048612 TaxID=3365579 RepID=UPI0037181276